MAQGLEFELKDIVLSNSSFGPQEIGQISRAISEDFNQFGVLRDAVQELEQDENPSPAALVRLGVCYYLLGRYEESERCLSNADGGALAQFYLGKTYVERTRFDEAAQAYEAAKVAGYNADECTLGVAQAQRYADDPHTAMQTLDNLFGAVEQTAEYLYQRGATVAAIGGNPTEVVALYERAVTTDAEHPGALFGLAMENDRRGNDQEALQLYERAANRFPANVGALINLGILYEDRQDFEKAQHCYHRILECYPGHQRATLYLRDASASGSMFYDEEAQKRHDRMSQVLNIPVTDFELSVRSRNCLQKMGIRTLGDLTRTSEPELLSEKNFGETSLVEIREILSAKGLRLGQFAHEKTEVESFDTSHLSPDEAALLERPISDLNLSVRARKCMNRLGMTSIGELCRKTPDDLLECKNFGVTSLNEVREKLTELNLKLRGE